MALFAAKSYPIPIVMDYPLTTYENLGNDLGSDILLSNAAISGDIDAMDLALRNGAQNKNEALKTSAEHGNMNAIKLLIRFGADDVGGAMYWAALRGHRVLLEYLLSLDDTLKNCALFAASSAGHIDCFDLLVEYGADDWSRAFCVACLNGHLYIIKKISLITKTNIINSTIEWNRGFINACSRGRLNVVRWMCDQRTCSIDWVWGVQAARNGGYTECANLCIKFGASLGYIDVKFAVSK